jgi:hypothetical protein
MKNRSFKPGLPYDLKQQLHGKVSLGTITDSSKPESEWDRTETIIEDILRWADDGGQMLDLGNLLAGTNPYTTREQANE